MKVMCIDASVGRTHGNIPSFKEGEVLDAAPSGYPDYYSIVGHEHNELGQKVNWFKGRFIPCSNICEMEMVRENEMQTI